MKNIKKVVVLGGGFLGLRIGSLLAEKGFDVDILEAEDYVGGMVSTFKVTCEKEDYFFDCGPHLFFAEFSNEYRSLIGGDLKPLSGNCALRVFGKDLLYPLKITDFLEKADIRISARVLKDSLFSLCKVTPSSIVTLDDWMIKKFGSTLCSYIFFPYAEKSTGLPIQGISSDWATERSHVTGENVFQIVKGRLREVLKGRREADLNLPSSHQIVACYPRKGAGQISLAMAETITERGGRIHLKTKVRKLRMKHSKVVAVAAEKEGCEEEYLGDFYISTIPLPQLVGALNYNVGNLLNRDHQHLSYRKLLLLCLLVERERILDYLEVYFPERDIPFKRIYEPKNMSRFMAPPGKSSICVEICYSEGDAICNCSDEQLFEKIVPFLEKENILEKNEVFHFFSHCLPYAYPIYSLGYKDYLEKIYNLIFEIPNLITTGRQGLYRYHAMTNESMEMAQQILNLVVSSGTEKKQVGRGKWGSYFC